MRMTIDEIEAFLRSAGNNFFFVRFIRRTKNDVAKAGDERRMRCRLNVKKHLKGGEWANGHAGSPRDHKLLTVYDTDAKDYRSIPLDGIIEMTVDHETILLPLP